MHLATGFTWLLAVALLFTSGCDVSNRLRYRPGTKLYSREGHVYYGQVVRFDNHHDFQNHMDPLPGVLLDLPAHDGHPAEQAWASCDVINNSYQPE